LFHICAFELASRDNEAANCKIHYFEDKMDKNKRRTTNRKNKVHYFMKTARGGSKKNNEDDIFCNVGYSKSCWVNEIVQ
jgi:hypothetical protein